MFIPSYPTDFKGYMWVLLRCYVKFRIIVECSRLQLSIKSSIEHWKTLEAVTIGESSSVLFVHCMCFAIEHFVDHFTYTFSRFFTYELFLFFLPPNFRVTCGFISQSPDFFRMSLSVPVFRNSLNRVLESERRLKQ